MGTATAVVRGKMGWKSSSPKAVTNTITQKNTLDEDASGQTSIEGFARLKS